MKRRRLGTLSAVAMLCAACASATAEEPVPTQAPAAPAEPTPARQGDAVASPAAWPPGLLMDGLGEAGARAPLDAIGMRVWGYVEAGFTGRLSGGQDPLPLRLFEARRPNELRLQQLRLTFDRPYDSAKNVGLGFRVDGLFGGDAMLTHTPGLFFHAGHGTTDTWADLTQMYVQPWIKTGPESGLEVTVGKFVTMHGYEVIDAPGNALFSRSYLFNFAIPFTHTGVKVNYIFNPQVSVYVAAVEGWDVFENNNRSWSEMAGAVLSSKEQIDGHARATVGLNFMTGPEQADNVSRYRTLADVVATYWWTEKLSEGVNFDYAVDEGASAVGGAAHWYGVAHYLTYAANECLTPTWRVEWFRDPQGVRTGTAANYYETTFGVAVTPLPKHPIFKNLTVRPEIRWDFADRAAFGGDRHNQLTAGVDAIFKF